MQNELATCSEARRPPCRGEVGLEVAVLEGICTELGLWLTSTIKLIPQALFESIMVGRISYLEDEDVPRTV